VTEAHLEHLRAHLERIRAGQVAAVDPERVFLGAHDGEFFQELVAFVMYGMPTVMLAALRFRSHGLPGVSYSRESLAAYLTHPPRGAAPWGGRVEALLPRTHEPIPSFLAGLRAGRAMPSVVLDPTRIRLAFDFRGHNPSAFATAKQAAGPLREVAVRTEDGHVLTGRSRAASGAGRDRFIALADAVQVTPRGPIRVPELIINRSWIAIAADVTDETTRVATGYWAPFQASDANPELVLGPLEPATPRATPTRPNAAALPESRFPAPLTGVSGA
jgi:hypothetical protein